METPYSKLDEAIDEGVQAMREQALDTSRMASVLKAQPRRSIVWPVGLATAAACACGLVVLMTPSKADAGEFEKVRKAVKSQKAVYEKIMARGKDQTWEVRLETWQDGKKSGLKTSTGYEVVLDGNKQYKKAPKEKFFEVVEPVKIVEGQKIEAVELKEIVLDDVVLADIVLVEGESETKNINEILARDGMNFLGIKRSQKHEGRLCDIYRVRMAGDENDTFYYVDPKTDLPYLMEEVRADGFVVRRTEIAFPFEIKLDVVVEGESIKLLSPKNLNLKLKDLKTTDKVIEIQAQPIKIVDGKAIKLQIVDDKSVTKEGVKLAPAKEEDKDAPVVDILLTSPEQK